MDARPYLFMRRIDPDVGPGRASESTHAGPRGRWDFPVMVDKQGNITPVIGHGGAFKAVSAFFHSLKAGGR